MSTHLPTAKPAPPPSRRGYARSVRTRAGTIKELAQFFRQTGRWWLFPMVAIFLLSAVILAIVHVVEYAAPFVYTIF